MIGIYGGTFNPIHLGHLRAAEEVCEALGLSRMLFVPSARPPHKAEPGDDVVAPAEARARWVELAIDGNPHFALDRIEIERPGPSYLVDTLGLLRDARPGEEFAFVVGQDAFAEMGTWRSPERIFRLCHTVVTTRPPIGSGHLADWLPACVRRDFEISVDGQTAKHREAGTWIRQVAVTDIAISASDVRARIRRGESIRYLVSDAVREAVLASGCYAAHRRDDTSR